MINLEALWQYQQKDVQVDQYESRMRQDPMRVKLLKLKTFYNQQQDAMKKVENETERVSKALMQAQSQFEVLTERVETETKGLESKQFDTAAQAKAQLAQVRDLVGKLNAMEQRLQQLMRDLNKSGKDLRAAKANASKARADYTELKTEYDKVFAAQEKEREELAKVRDAAAAGIDPQLLQKYQQVKKRCSPPIALLRGDQCGGCNMSQPAVVVSAAKKGERIVECETCGRIIYVRD